MKNFLSRHNSFLIDKNVLPRLRISILPFPAKSRLTNGVHIHSTIAVIIHLKQKLEATKMILVSVEVSEKNAALKAR